MDNETGAIGLKELEAQIEELEQKKKELEREANKKRFEPVIDFLAETSLTLDEAINVLKKANDTKNKKGSRKSQTFTPIPCNRCGKIFTPRYARMKMCEECTEITKQEKKAKQESDEIILKEDGIEI